MSIHAENHGAGNPIRDGGISAAELRHARAQRDGRVGEMGAGALIGRMADVFNARRCAGGGFAVRVWGDADCKLGAGERMKMGGERMTTVYLVSSGEYSDYGIRAVFSTKELAELYIQSLGDPQGYTEKMMIEEYPLDENEAHIRDGFHPYQVRMERDGTTTKIRLDTWDASVASTVSLVDGRYWRETGRKELWVSCVAKDEQHAVKIANEKRIQLIATGAWA